MQIKHKPSSKPKLSKPAPKSDLRAVRQAATALVGPPPDQSDVLLTKRAAMLTTGYLRNKASFGGALKPRDIDYLGLYTLVSDDGGTFTARGVASYILNPFYPAELSNSAYDTGTIVRTRKHGSVSSPDGETFKLSPQAIALGTKRLRRYIETGH